MPSNSNFLRQSSNLQYVKDHNLSDFLLADTTQQGNSWHKGKRFSGPQPHNCSVVDLKKKEATILIQYCQLLLPNTIATTSDNNYR